MIDYSVYGSIDSQKHRCGLDAFRDTYSVLYAQNTSRTQQTLISTPGINEFAPHLIVLLLLCVLAKPQAR